MRATAGHLLAVAGFLTAGAHPARAEGGLPQLDASTYPSQIFWLFVAFVLLYLLMSRVALPPIATTIEARRARRKDDLAAAEKANTEAQAVRLAYEQALARAQDEARQLVLAAENEIKLTTARQDESFGITARTRLQEAESNIARARSEALTSVADIAADIAADAFGRILPGKSASKAQAKKSVEDSVRGEKHT